MNEVITIVFSDLFKREKKMYSVQDFKLLVPLSLKMVGNVLLCTMIWFLPIYLIFGLGFVIQPKGLLISVGPVVLMTMFISKPSVVFNNKSFYSWAFCNIKYVFAPKYYTDGKSSSINNGDRMNGDFVIWMRDSLLDDDGNDIMIDADDGKKNRSRKRGGK